MATSVFPICFARAGGLSIAPIIARAIGVEDTHDAGTYRLIRGACDRAGTRGSGPRAGTAGIDRKLSARELVGYRQLRRSGGKPAAELGRSFNLLYYSYDVNGTPTYGRLGTDRPHQFKVQGTYDLPWGTMIGVNALVESGVPKSTIMSQKNINFFPYGRGDLGRTPAFSQIDLLLQQDFRLPSNMRVTIGLNAINLFDQKTVTGYQTTPYRDGFNAAGEVLILTELSAFSSQLPAVSKTVFC